ncbi:MAG: multiheme c-type cytochrome [Puia sp.]
MICLQRIRKQNLTVLVIFMLVGLGSLCCAGFGSRQSHVNHAGDSQNPYAGSASCQGCHKEIYDTHILTAHYLSSRPPLGEYIKGGFSPSRNHFRFNKFTDVVMDKTDSGFYQTAYVNDVLFQREAFGMVIGSGRKGQTYLYWKDSTLFQLPISYYTPQNSWCVSPGYPSALIYFYKTIPPNCMECHASFVKTAPHPNGTVSFDSSTLIYGIDCERCHGPSAAHVAFHLKNPDEKIARFVINPKWLDRQQRLDACALCHSGFRKEKLPAFSFQEGDKLDDFSTATFNDKTNSALDVHGNQYGLLTASKCFKSSPMDCSSCHNVHRTELNDPVLFSSRCITCHQEKGPDTCTLIPPKGLVLRDDCVDCHMPLLPSKKIFLQMDDPSKSTPDLVRTHRIAIYPDITKKFLAARSLKAN